MLGLLWLTSMAQGASLDLLEVGGAWGTPGATNPTAIWWNPAGLAVGGGTQVLVEGAPTFAKVFADRDNPDYGEITPVPGSEMPTDYDYGGRDTLTFNGVVPFVGLSSDFTVDGLGVGIGLAVPTARGGTSDQENGPNRYALRDGNIQAIHAIAAASYQIADVVSIGLSGSFVDSRYTADTDLSAYPDLTDNVKETLGALQDVHQEGHMERLEYSSGAVFELSDTALTFGAGVYVTPLDQLGISVAYNHGFRLDNQGTADLTFRCPPDWDPILRLGTVQAGLCNGQNPEQLTEFTADASIGYRLPSRVNVGVVMLPVERVRLELMGAWVGWGVFTDYEINTSVDAEQVENALTPEDAEETAGLISQPRLWARDAQNTFWVGIDGKVRVHDMVIVGARTTFDKAAIPDAVLSANNVDFDSLILSGLGVVEPLEQLGIGVSVSQHLLFSRTVTNSAYALTLDEDERAAPRYFWPSANGTYGGSITRIGVSVRGTFGGASRW